MKNIALFATLTLIVLQHQALAFSHAQLNAGSLLKNLKETNSRIMTSRIELGEALIKHLEIHGSNMQSEKMKSIYRIATDYQKACDCEHRVLQMYSHTKPVVKVYLSAQSRDIVQKQKMDLDESLKSLQRYLSEIGDKEIIGIVTNLQSRIMRAQEILEDLIEYYSAENSKYKQSIGDRYD